jgi:hypothetical protein
MTAGTRNEERGVRNLFIPAWNLSISPSYSPLAHKQGTTRRLVEAGCIAPVYYMFPGSQALECPNLVISNQLLVVRLSHLSHPPGNMVNCPESNRADYSLRHLVRNPESYLAGYPASYPTGYLPKNSASNREDCLGLNLAGCSADCPDNCPESNLRSNEAGNLPGYSESSPVDSLPGWLGSCLPMPAPRFPPEPSSCSPSSRRAQSGPVACG